MWKSQISHAGRTFPSSSVSSVTYLVQTIHISLTTLPGIILTTVRPDAPLNERPYVDLKLHVVDRECTPLPSPPPAGLRFKLRASSSVDERADKHRKTECRLPITATRD